MSNPFFLIWNKHDPSGGEPPTISNELGSNYCGYFQNRFGEQWVFVYDPERKVGELRGGDIGWDKTVIVRDGRADDLVLGKAEALWLQACWNAATFTS